jgi:signal transduction histidine kinase/DNA-binding response OmpR family regulator
VKNKSLQILKVSIVAVVFVCILVFAFLVFYFNKKNTESVYEVGSIYMEEMSEHISSHFNSSVNRWIRLLEEIEENVDEVDGEKSHEAMLKALENNGRARDFKSLGLCSEDGTIELIYGDGIAPLATEPFLEAVKTDGRRIGRAVNASGEEMVSIGLPASYTMSDGKKSVALIGTLAKSDLTEILNPDRADSLVFSVVICNTGDILIQNGDVTEDNYFDRIRTRFKPYGKDSVEDYVSELERAIETGESYTDVFYIGDELRYMYFASLPYSNWNLITIMPDGFLRETINENNTSLTVTSLACCGIVIILLLIVFVHYFKMSTRQLKEVERARQAAINASKAKSEFLSNMSHDIRTPMNAIVGMTAIAASDVDDKRQVQNCLKKISLSSKHMLGLINDILDMSKIESGKLTLNVEMVSLREVMDSIVSVVQPQLKAKKQKFDVFISDISVENVYCDSVRLDQIILNLMSNAIKFTPEGGSVSICLNEEDSPRGEDYIRVHLRVKDNGIGMSPEFVDKIFDSFTREDSARVYKTEGTGLGMAITKYIVDAMEGSIDVQSEQGKGTEFRVTLDLERAAAQEENMELPKVSVLLVDDDVRLCKSAVALLGEMGVNAEYTIDGETALRIVEDRHRRHKDFQIILLDWKMPGIDGIETARRVRRIMGETVPILLISAYDWSEVESEARVAGIDSFISKPLFKSTLYYGLKPFTDSDESVRNADAATVDLKGKHIIVAEDNDINWEIALALLSAYGPEIERAENGSVCVEKFKQSREGYYSAILMDIRMPVMTGYEATEAIRSLKRGDNDIPIIAMTADAFSEDIDRCIKCGMNAHIAKPIDVEEIVKVLARYL